MWIDPGWILVTCSGTVGATIITYQPHLDRIISHDLLRVQLNDNAMRGYVYTFLRTWLGKLLMRSSHYGNVIKHLEVSHLQALPVPILDSFVADLNEQIDAVFRFRHKAYELDTEAGERFSEGIGREVEPASEAGFSVQAANLFEKSRRLDAFAHNPTAIAVAAALRASSNPIESVADCAKPVLPTRFTRIYGERGTPLLGSEDIFKVNPEITKFVANATPIEIENYSVEPGWLLMSRSGQIYGFNGTVILASEMHKGKIVTEHVIRIIPDRSRVRSGYLQVALNHPVFGRPLVLRNAFGTSVPHLAPEDIAEIPVVRLGKKNEDWIADSGRGGKRFAHRGRQE